VAIIGDVVSIARDRAAIVPRPRLTSDFTLEVSNGGAFEWAGAFAASPAQRLRGSAEAGPAAQHVGLGAMAGAVVEAI